MVPIEPEQLVFPEIMTWLQKRYQECINAQLDLLALGLWGVHEDDQAKQDRPAGEEKKTT
jgi:hypothetical protein